MKFHNEEKRILPYSRNDIIISVYEQLKNDTMFTCKPLGSYGTSEGISFLTRREKDFVSENGSLPTYKVSNDERRRLMRELKEHLKYLMLL